MLVQAVAGKMDSRCLNTSPEGFLIKCLGYRFVKHFHRKVRKGVKKRITRHMHELGYRRFNHYMEIVSSDQEVETACKRHLAVSISRFFRDIELWEVFRDKTLPKLIATMGNEESKGPFKVWSCGCARGEEAYSFWILWEEFKQERESCKNENRHQTEEIKMEVKEAIAGRLSIRRYAESSIPPEHMETLFRALQLAPSANNGQNWQFIFVDDAEIKRRLVGACSNQSFVGTCTYFIAGVADPGQKWHMVDITIALTNFTLQAADLGYGTCWIGAFDETRVKGILGVPDERKVVICMTFGTPEGRHVPKRRKAFENFLFLNYYGRHWNHNQPQRCVNNMPKNS